MCSAYDLVVILTNRLHCFKSGDIPKTEGGQTNLRFMTVL